MSSTVCLNTNDIIVFFCLWLIARKLALAAAESLKDGKKKSVLCNEIEIFCYTFFMTDRKCFNNR